MLLVEGSWSRGLDACFVQIGMSKFGTSFNVVEKDAIFTKF
jgi:hypothetical protein